PLAILLRRRRAQVALTPAAYSTVLRSMQRRKISHPVGGAAVTLPRARPPVTFEAGIIRPIGRLFVWLSIYIRFNWCNLLDLLAGRAIIELRAVRLRHALEGCGPTFAKLGQQLSMRIDMLPYAYCAELAKMLDQAPPIRTEQAIEIIERNPGRPLEDVFKIFD